MLISKSLEDKCFEYIEKNSSSLDVSYQECYPERCFGEYYDTEEYERFIFEIALDRVQEGFNEDVYVV